MKILLAVDGSDCALRAVDHLIQMAALWREAPHIDLLHVHAPIPIGRVQAHLGHDTLAAYYREESEAALASAQQRLTAAGVAFTSHIHVGLPAEVIAHQAQVLGSSQIVIGARGQSAFVGLLLGSVAQRLAQLASCPVLLVK